MSSSATDEHFGRIASDYDALRPVDDDWWEVFDALVRLGDLRGRRVLELGCGTGRLAAALAGRAVAKVWAVDASPEMVAAARSRGVTARTARADALPFKDGWFERVVARMVVHLLDRPAAFAEAARVLAPAGRIGIATIDPERFGEHWLNPWFPSIARIDAERFPDAATLEAELSRAGFEPRLERLAQEVATTRERALGTMRGRAFSTFALIPEDEYREGLARAERELPERLEYRRSWLLAAGVR